jgi:peroxiredoxin
MMESNVKLLAGDEAPDFTVTDLNGESVSLSDFRGKSSVVMVFMRYIGCPLCRRYMARLAECADDFKSAGAELMVFVQSSSADIKKHSPVKSYPYRVIPDPDAKVYGIYGVGRVSPLSMLNPQVALGVVKAMAGGHSHGLMIGDELRAPGAFVVDKNGVLRMSHTGETVADVPKTEELLGVLGK